LGVPAASAAVSAKGHGKRVCGTVTGRVAACSAEVLSAAKGGSPLATSTYQSGYAPNDLRSAYNVAGPAMTQGGTQTIAIVDAYDAPNAETDLGVYRAQFGLPACTTGNGCFRKVNQDGGTAPPAVDAGWAQEVSLDLDMVSAVCPSCRILLVEANSASYADLGAAVDRAAAMGATQISNSYGGSEQFGSSYDSHYDHPGIDITASSGDSGYGVSFPASSPHVTAVGGTHLVKDGSARGWTETVWSGAGSGCSSVFPKPSYQQDPGCAKRSVADVSAVADPATGVAVYDSYPYQGASGWFVFGGTSVAAPVIAAVNALAGGRSPGTMYGGFAYANPSLFFDVVSGSNGSCGSLLCTARAGWDGPTGLGTPNGTGAF
jgi:subtilase family serine protease